MKKLSKLELLELLAEQEREILALKQQLEEKEKLLAQKTLRAKQFGNIAQAALAVNEVFEAAQKAADQYLESVKIGLEERLQRDGAFPYVSKMEQESGNIESQSQNGEEGSADEKMENRVDEILRSIYEYEVVDECSASMKPDKKTPKHRRRESE